MILILLFALQIVPVNTSFQIAFEYPDAPPDKFRLWCDAAIVKNYTNAEVRLGKSATVNAEGDYTYTLSAPGLILASHTCDISVFGPDGIERHSTPIRLEPVLRVVTQNQDTQDDTRTPPFTVLSDPATRVDGRR